MTRLLRVAMVWAQIGPYHTDRCQAVAAHLCDKIELCAVEVAQTSLTYLWPPVEHIEGTQMVTLFPGEHAEAVGPLRRLWRLWRQLRRFDYVFLGIGYGDLDGAALPWLLRPFGVRTVLVFDSKHDDKPRRPLLEQIKRLLVAPHVGAIVGGPRHMAYARSLGFRRRRVLPGCDGVSLARVRSEARASGIPGTRSFADREFLFVGRFVEKKNLFTLLSAYALYCREQGPASRRLRLVGSGPLEDTMRSWIDAAGLQDMIAFEGFLDSTGVSRALYESLALILPSTSEQWGLVVNEALAVGLPVIVSTAVGAGDLLVRQDLNGFVVDPNSPEDLCDAMIAISDNEGRWRDMAKVSASLAWRGDCARFVEAVEAMLFPNDEKADAVAGAFLTEIDQRSEPCR